MKRIIIVGAGASGVYLSILLKKNINDICVTVLEQNQTSLKKLLATGNGRCNLSNKNISIQSYFSDRLDIVEPIIHDFSMPLQMNEIGLYTLYHNHLLYPKSEQASSVKDVFMNEAKRYGVQFLYEQQVYQIEKKILIIYIQIKIYFKQTLLFLQWEARQENYLEYIHNVMIF